MLASIRDFIEVCFHHELSDGGSGSSLQVRKLVLGIEKGSTKWRRNDQKQKFDFPRPAQPPRPPRAPTMASYSPLLNNLAFLVLLSALISLYLVGCGFSIDFLGRMSKLFQTEEHCAQAYRASHADYISGRAGDSVPPMPTIKWLGAFWLSTLVGLGLSLAVVLLAWVTRNNKILGGSKNPPKHFTLDNFAESVAKSNLFVAWGLICTIIGLVSSITYSESLDTRPFSAGPYGTGIDGNPRFTFRTWVESDLAEYK